MRNVLLLSLIFPVLLTACHQRYPQTQRLQIASLIAGARYLKQQCGRGDFPGDGQIEQSAYRAARHRGWSPSADIRPYSERLYQGLLKDATPPATQCAEFSQLLQPFIATLPVKS
ncbi:type II secretion system pilot lipoprotein GspS [Tenebrionibacter intestinalis]|uniref:Type II secretion system pilot lipoprotein GspS n=1 Tax=Tenebrionibacter intestinalis TaxID=2799638 RepID=A0A8K0V2W4_9ENTR|nr:type II secretion system pilot lipoprotein GspS [Tenebrionibacter intestinalis]MBK4716092.1 type II secretion system pilot lipoprotein GspS [Tenebrionibacter intestinalis]